MTIEEAAKILSRMYQGAPEDEKVVRIHLFAIQHAEQLDGMPLVELTVRAGVSESYKTEIRKGIKLARYVQLKPPQ